MARKPSLDVSAEEASEDSESSDVEDEPLEVERKPREVAKLHRKLESYTVKGLRQKAHQWDIDLQGKRRKAEIIDVMVGALTRRREEPVPPPPEHEVPPDDLDDELHFGKLEDLWIEATNALAGEDYKSALALSRDSLQLLEEWSARYKRGMCLRAIQAAELFASRFNTVGSAQTLKRKVAEARRAREKGDLGYCARLIEEIQGDVATVYVEEMGRVREILVEKESILEELGVINADLARGREMLIRAEEALRLGNHSRTLELIHSFEEVVEEARQKRRAELSEYLSSVEEMLQETEDLGNPLRDARKLAQQARTAFERGDLVLASEIAQRCEKTAMEAQKKQIEAAMQLRRKHYRDVRDLVAYLKPLLREAQDYGIETEDIRELVRDAVELLRKEDYFLAMERGQEARRFLESLQPSIAAEREKRGIRKPRNGVCEECGSEDLEFWDDGWSVCNSCGHQFLWPNKDEPRSITFFRRKRLIR